MRLATMFGRMPQDVFDMPYRHFLLACRHAEQVERDRAFYVALAYHDPGKLAGSPQGKQDFKANRDKVARLLGAKGR
nr:hypothetical protein [uncultured Dethiosulfovibrio sp.]